MHLVCGADGSSVADPAIADGCGECELRGGVGETAVSTEALDNDRVSA